ncbi:hypothetical protein [Paramaledivibacter caminithermalis]|jgi:hypothetical protein|uniref:Uncharacterized protein n=1 Tax=Paramaledivibacter caminithermalis (strain DSM 15212 / CIP 107654 / DViRD3) TaxID=1121301 RepID=A0A1M6PSJ3_PARC5|nr:hypothetical protein [Paramaledivibacter caminithermalis]SHK10861.1 hypothetical protein SAMN02745912_02275 [Paramaledivibacter caminithermalis DSM 15212]
MVIRYPSGVMGKPEEISDYICVKYREIKIFFKQDILNKISNNKLELLLEGYGKYIIEFEE